jgi:hypothetical protein
VNFARKASRVDLAVTIAAGFGFCAAFGDLGFGAVVTGPLISALAKDQTGLATYGGSGILKPTRDRGGWRAGKVFAACRQQGRRGQDKQQRQKTWPGPVQFCVYHKL